jgi:hypothetical protein
MTTEYEWIGPERPVCSTCGHQGERFRLPIGLSVIGYRFSLNVDPTRPRLGPDTWGPATLEHWIALFAMPGSEIRNEVGRVITAEDMLRIIRRGDPFDNPDFELFDFKENHRRT